MTKSCDDHMTNQTFILPSSEPVTNRDIPLRAELMLLTKEVCPLSFFILSPTSQSQTAPVLSTEQVNTMLQDRNGLGRACDQNGLGK